MEISYTKNYTKRDYYKHFTIYDDLSFKDTNVFHEYYGLITGNGDKSKEGIIKLIQDYQPESRSKLRWSLEGETLSFYPPNKYIFPKFYVIFK